MIIFFVDGNNVLEGIEANLENFLIVSTSRLSIYNIFENLDLSSLVNNFLLKLRLDLTLFKKMNHSLKPFIILLSFK